MLETLQAALAALTESAYHYFAQPNSKPPYIVWAEDSDNDLMADNVHAEHMYQGTVDLYTNADADPLTQSIPAAFEAIGAAYYLNSVQFEEETNLVHFEWVWEFYG